MNIRMKTGLVLCAAIFLVVIAVVITSRTMLLRNFAELDEERLRTNVERATSSLENELSNLSAMNRDWASWDDTYEFIVDRNEDYINVNPVDEGFRNLRLNLMVFVNSAGEVVYSKAFDLRKEKEVTPPDIFQRNLSPADTLLLHSADPTSTVAGILLLPEGPMLITSNPILTSNAEGPVRGSLIWGRYLDDEVIDALSQQTLLSLDIISFTDGQSLPNFQQARPQLLEDAIFVGLLSSESIGGYSLIRDIYGKPALIVRVDVPREIYHQGLATVNYFLIIIMLASLLFGVLAYLLIDKLVLSRLARLSVSVSDIGTKGDFSARVSLPGNDELSDLAGTISATLGELGAYQQALVNSERKYSTLVEKSSDGVIVIRDGLLKFTNPKIPEMTGLSPEDVIGKSFLTFVTPGYRDLVADSYKRRMAGEAVSPKYEIEILGKDGRKIPVEVNASVIDYEGKPADLAILHDITERKQADERAKELYQKETALRQELEAEIDKRIAFTRTLVHELKTPLTPMIAASELLMQEIPGESLFRLAKSINKGAETLSKRIDALLDVAKGELGILELVRTETDLLDLLHNIAEDMTPLADSHNQVLSVELPVSLPTVSLDGERIRQVVVNLLDNSFKFTPGGGKITLKGKIKGDAIVVEVEDTGPGIPVDQQPHLFKGYSHIKSKSEHGRGLGLGLALSKILVELHGGKIWVESQEGKGSKFGFSVPLHSSAS